MRCVQNYIPSGALEPKAFARLLDALTRRAPLNRALQYELFMLSKRTEEPDRGE